MQRARRKYLGEIGHNGNIGVLSPYIAGTQVAPSTVHLVNHLPDGTSTLIFRLMDNGHADLHVLGRRRRAMYKRVSSARACLKVVFRPGDGYAFFNVPLVELADRAIPLRELWGPSADTLLDKLVHMESNAGRIVEMKTALTDRLRAPKTFEPVAVPMIREATEQLSTRQVTLHEVAHTLNVSERHLRRAFSQLVGLSPKRYARILRFRQAVARASHGAAEWSQIAVESGYFDQSHMCADFQDLARASPEALVRNDAVEVPRGMCP